MAQTADHIVFSGMYMSPLQLDAFLDNDKASQLGNSKSIGVVYTPKVLAHWVAELLNSRLEVVCPRVLDPACGDGVLLKAFLEKASWVAQPIGWDLDASALSEAASGLNGVVTLYRRDALDALSNNRAPLEVDAVIANPPWARVSASERVDLKQKGYVLAEGQCDYYEIFIESMIRRCPAGTFMAFILPDSIFYPEHKRLREFLLKNTKIHVIARLGEGIFKGVYRETVVLLIENQSRPVDVKNEIECLRLRKTDRKLFLNNSRSINELLKGKSIKTDQQRFWANKDLLFDVDVSSDDVVVQLLNKVKPLEWSRYFHIGRGIEIGKKGKIVKCLVCNMCSPAPRALTGSACPYCGANYERNGVIDDIVARSIPEKDGASWAPLLVGEDVNRYSCFPSRWVRLGVRGVKYKPSLFDSNVKLLVRKTGVGIRSAIDQSNSMTTQTVYHFIPKDGVDRWVISYVAGVLNSRILLAYYIKVYGGSEWRSHPYITPSVIKKLPIPDPRDYRGEAYPVALRIADLVESKSLSVDVELEIESLVASLFGLGNGEFDWVKNVIENADSLEGIKELVLKDSDNLVTPIVESIHE